MPKSAPLRPRGVRSPISRLLTLCLLAWLPVPIAAAPVDAARIQRADPSGWVTLGGNYAETRESPLTLIDSDNVHRLGLAWYHDLGTKRGLEATPLVIGKASA